MKLAAYPFGFDLVPAWLRNPNGYWIPDTDINAWLPTDPDAHAKLLTDVNEFSKLKLKPLIKMTKHWSRNNHDLLRSFHIELICVDLVRSRKIDPDISLPLGIATILVHLQSYVGKLMMDPTYATSRVDKELSAVVREGGNLSLVGAGQGRFADNAASRLGRVDSCLGVVGVVI